MRLRETRGYLQFAIDVADKQIPQPSGERPTARLAEKALYVAQLWSKLQRKVKNWGGVLVLFSKPYQVLPTSNMASGKNLFSICKLQLNVLCSFAGRSLYEFLDRVVAAPDKLIHPYLIDIELCLKDMKYHFLSLSDFWARGTGSDPATFASWLQYVLFSPS